MFFKKSFTKVRDIKDLNFEYEKIDECTTRVIITDKDGSKFTRNLRITPSKEQMEKKQNAPIVRFVKDHPDAVIPKYAYSGDAGMDLSSVEDVIIPPNRRRMVSTGLRMAIPYGYEGQVRPRSGLAAKYGITILNSPGTIDFSFRGIGKVILFNTDTHAFVIKKGDRIAQLVIAKCSQAQCLEVDLLDETERGMGGFGSTGR